MSKQSVYIETSVVSYLVAKPSRDRLTAIRQEITKRWWASRHRYVLMISNEVNREAGRGDAKFAQHRLDALLDIPVLLVTELIIKSSDTLVKAGIFPQKAHSDAIHVGFASAYAADILLTWNLKHLANPVSMKRTREIVTMLGMKMPEICTPEQLLAVGE